MAKKERVQHYTYRRRAASNRLSKKAHMTGTQQLRFIQPYGQVAHRARTNSAPAPSNVAIDPFTEIEDAAPVLAAAAALTELDLVALELLEAGLEVDAGDAATGEEGPVVGAGMAPEEAPLIWAWIVELNCPLIPFRVNLAENASTGKLGLLGSLAAAEVNRMKYTLLLGPIVGLTVN